VKKESKQRTSCTLTLCPKEGIQRGTPLAGWDRAVLASRSQRVSILELCIFLKRSPQWHSQPHLYSSVKTIRMNLICPFFIFKCQKKFLNPKSSFPNSAEHLNFYSSSVTESLPLISNHS
jgi:hypothetical protein